MFHQQQTCYETTSNCYVEHVPVVVYQTMGDCPVCHIGFLQSEMTCLGVCCCILFFPLGLICLFLIQDQTCPNCGYTTS